MKIFIDFSKEAPMKKPAFTMLELVFVIVVLGILAALAMPRLDRDLEQEAKDNILSAIRYTQHLALIDDKTVPGTAWQANLWNIAFDSTTLSYKISSDAGANVAIDPINGQEMDGTTQHTLIGKKYSVSSIGGSCTTVAFDNLGRPFIMNLGGSSYDDYRATDCTIVITLSTGTFTVRIASETGHVSID